MLVDPTRHGGNEEDTFEVICPSLPGYGFSEAAHKQGSCGSTVLSLARARTCGTIMCMPLDSL